MDELTTAGWEFAKEELDGGNDLLLKLLIVDSEAFLNCIALEQGLVDFCLNLASIDVTVDI